MRSRGTVAACTVAGLLLTAPAALADEEIVGATPNRYSNPNVTIDQGEPLTFRNTDFAMHDVTSETAGLFASETIGQNATSYVEGSQYLTTGSYNFYCSVHPQMKGTITVNSAGTPAPRPGAGGSAPDTTPPGLSFAPLPARAAALRKRKPLRFDVGMNEAGELAVNVFLRKLKAGRVVAKFDAAGKRRLTLVLNRKVRRKLRKGSKLTIAYLGTDTAQNSTGDQVTLKLR